MGNKTIRLGSTLTFDEDQEKDIIELIEALNSSHKTGQFLSNLIRVAVDCPEVLAKVNGTYDIGPAMRQLDTLGMSQSRKQFMSQVAREIQAMREKVDEVYKQSYKVYALSKIGKTLGIEKRSDNNLMAAFVCQRQLNILQDKLGMAFIGDTYISDKMDTSHKMVDETLEYIIDTYNDIVDELRRSLNIEAKKLEIPVEPVTIPVNNVDVPVNTLNIPVNPVNIPVNPLNIPVEKIQVPVVSVSATSGDATNTVGQAPSVQNETSQQVQENSDDDIIDFGDSADLGALGNFFGD